MSKEIIKEKAKNIADGIHELTLQDLNEILSVTIIKDYVTKTILFLTWLLTYTEHNQINIILKGETSVGKTYNVNEITWYFPPEDILSFAGASPTSFIHKSNAILVDKRTMSPIPMSMKPEKGDVKELWDEWYDLMRNKAYYLDYSGKIIIFPDAPDTRLLAKIRPLLSHDQKKCVYSVTSKRKGGDHQTKDVIIEGFFTCTFCTASHKLDEQEISRHIMLSPEDTPEKLQESIDLLARKHSDIAFVDSIERDPLRLALKQRVSKIKEEITESITDIYIPPIYMEELKLWFFEQVNVLSPKIQRDFPRLIALAQAFAILNWKHRERKPKTKNLLYCNKSDIEAAKVVYGSILRCNELGLTPEEYDIFKFLELEAVEGLTIQNAHSIYFKNKKRSCSDRRLRNILKTYCRAGLFRETKEGKTLKYFPLTKEVEGQTILAPKTKPDTLREKEGILLDYIKEYSPTMDDLFNKFNPLILRSEIEKIVTQLESRGVIYKPDGFHYKIV